MPATSHPTTPVPHRRRRARRRKAALVAVAVAALALTASACGGDDDASATLVEPAPTTAPPASEPDEPAEEPGPVEEPDEQDVPAEEEGDEPVKEPDPAEDPDEIDEDELDDARARVERINLVLEDLPEGWIAEDPIDEVESVVSDCTENGGGDDVVARAASDRFSLIVGSGRLGLDTSSGYLRDEIVAEDLMAELGGEDFAACATEHLLSAEDVTVEGSLTPVGEVADLADEVVALQGDFSLSDTSGATAELSALVIAVRTDQVITTVSATALDTPGDEALLDEVLQLVAERQEA